MFYFLVCCTDYCCYNKAMYIESVPNRNSPPAILLRESHRVGRKIKKRTLANLSKWPPHLVEGLRVLLKGGQAVPDPSQMFRIVRSLPHGHVAATLGAIHRLGLSRVLAVRPSPERDRVVAMIAARILDPRSKLATARGLAEETRCNSLAEQLSLGSPGEEDLYAALDWLLARQSRIESKLAKRHLQEGSLVLYDVTSTYFEGETCPLVQRGYSRDGKKEKQQIVFGLVCDRQGCPMAVEVFAGNVADPSTLQAQLDKLRQRFGLRQIVMVGDRGLLTQARIREQLRPLRLDWISALRSPQIRKLVTSGALQLSLFDEKDLAEIESSDYPGERLVVCKNPLLAERRAAKRQLLLQATEVQLERIVAAVQRPQRALKGRDRIGLRVGRVLQKYKVGKHFDLDIGEDHFSYRRKQQNIDQEAALDGLYVIRTSLSSSDMPTAAVVGVYKSLSQVERAFRCLKSIDLRVRPVYHRLESRVRAHIFLCMLAYYVQWHMRRWLAPVLFQDDDKDSAQQLRESVVAPAQRSPRASKKAQSKRSQEGWPVHSFQTLLADLATITKNRVQPGLPEAPTFDQITLPTPFQKHVFDLLQVRL